MAVWWYGDDSPHLSSCHGGKKTWQKSEQARLVKTVKVHMPVAKAGYGSDRRLPPWETVGGPACADIPKTSSRRMRVASTSTHMPKLMSGSLSTGSPAGHLNTRQRGVPVHGGSMYSQAHVNPRPHTPEADHRLEHNGEPKRVSMAPGGRRLLKRGKPRALGVAGLEVEDLSHSEALGSNRPACHGKVSSPGVRPQREP